MQIDTTARADAESYPSSPGQLELGRLLVAELQALGIADARQDPARHRVWRRFPPRRATETPAPTIALCAHLDTSPETTGAGVKPQVIENYPGGDIVLPGDPSRVIRVADNPELAVAPRPDPDHHRRHDAARAPTTRRAWPSSWRPPPGWSSIPRSRTARCGSVSPATRRSAAASISSISHEIGAAACYTLDGHGTGEIDVETFSADQAVVTIRGVNIHPSIAKGRMTNAVRAAGRFRRPAAARPPLARNDRRPRGFLHPYEIGGGVAEVKLQDPAPRFRRRRSSPSWPIGCGRRPPRSMREFPAAKIDVHDRAAVSQHGRGAGPGAAGRGLCPSRPCERLGRTAKLTIVRGGTDGSRLTELGLPTPNLSCGGHNPHSPLEWACLEEMVESVEWLIALAETWGKE